MAIEAVVSVVIQKLTDMLIEEPVVFDKVIDQVEAIRIKLRQMRGFLIGAEENQGHDETVKKWADDYLRILYDVEDMVETFALRIARQSHTRFGGALLNHCPTFFFYFNNLKACQKLRRRMKGIEFEINKLNKKRPGKVRDLSFQYHSSEPSFKDEGSSCHPDQQSSFGRDPDHQVNDHEKEEHQEEEEEISIIQTVRPGKTTAIQTVCRGSSFQENLSQPTSTPSFSYEEEESGAVVFEEDVRTLVKRLTDDKAISGSSHTNILPIFGAAGSGKTTFAQAIYKSKGIKRHFERRAWVSVSKDYTETDVLLNLLKQVGTKSKDQGLLKPEQLVNKLLELLKEKKCLLVIDIDDVRTCDVWNKLKHAFEDARKGSKMIIITWDEQVALSAGPDPHYMKGLNEQESWKVFLKKARWNDILTGPYQDLNIFQLRPRILELCKGLPLRIALLGGLLSTKRVSDDEWVRVLDHISLDTLGVQWHTGWEGAGFCGDKESLAILSFCYNDLPVHSKLCLLYLVLFPKEFDIPVRRLVRLWLAEGFVKRSPTMIPEDVAQEHFDDLVKRNMVQITKWRSDGSPRRCRLLGALHDFLQPKTQDISLFYVHRNSNCNVEGLRRIVEYLDIKNYPFNFKHIWYLRSYISFNLQRKDIPAMEVATFLRKLTGSRGFTLLRVLDLEGVYKPSLPDKLGDLFHLRYLGLRWTFLDYLPPSVGDLHYLETLDLKKTYINSLPSSIWKLKHLRHLNLNEIRLDMPDQPHSPRTKLLTLWGLFVDDKSPVKYGLSRLRDLRELGITFTLSQSSSLDKDLARWISNLTNLQTLRLRSKDEMGRPSKLHLESLSCLVKLSRMNLLGHLPKLPAKHEFPPGLKVLTLSVSSLTEDPMPTLGQLPSLTVLRLLAKSYLGKKIVCPLRGFSELKVLKLWMLKDLEEWEVKEGAMQYLKELDVRCCNKLSSVPLSVLQRLEEVTLTNMPDTFIAKIRQQKSEHTSLTVNEWSFTSLPWEQDNDSEIA